MNKFIFIALLGLTLADYKDKCANDDLVLQCGGDGRTYKNKCYREVAGAELAYYGKCTHCEYCTGAVEYVCGNDGRSYTNSCWADCNGTFVVSKGKCKEKCECPQYVDLVCGANGVTYTNACIA